jgi:MFS transporter, NNP family, nitrate/nitrite transporter
MMHIMTMNIMPKKKQPQLLLKLRLKTQNKKETRMGKVHIDNWDVENDGYWEGTAKKIASKNLWISIPALLLAFSVWLMWSIIIVQMQRLGFNFGMSDAGEVKSMLYTLPAIAGLAGATLRIPNSFLISIGGGRNVIGFTTALLLIPAIGVGIALQNPETPYMVFAILAATSGFGGGNFASSMSNISFFYPKRMQGTSLGLNAGLGNLGVSVMQFLLPITMGMGIFGGASMLYKGKDVFIQNCGWTWVPFLIIAAIAAWFGMNNVSSGTPKEENTLVHLGKSAYLVLLGIIGTAVGATLLIKFKINMWVVLPITVVTTVLLMKYLSPSSIKDNLNKQFAIFNNKHNWIMTIIYTMTFGSFIGFSAAFPKLIQDVFGYLPDGSINPLAPNPMHWAFLGPMVGALIRPVGGWLSDKIKSGSRVTAFSTTFQILAALGVAYFVLQAKGSAAPQEYWWPFFFLFMILFIMTGIGNGSTFRSIPYIFNKEQAGPVLGWTSAIAAYGAFIIPKVFGQQIKLGHAEYALYGFAVYYLLCLVLNWWYYDRKGAEIQC